LGKKAPVYKRKDGRRKKNSQTSPKGESGLKIERRMVKSKKFTAAGPMRNLNERPEQTD